MSHVDILLAEDFDAFREFACRELQGRGQFRVVAVSDGLAAVEQARELQPRLILLDIGLPSLDGLAAARRIRSLTPAARIVFLTQESSADAIHEALALGADGYIHKGCAQHLLSTVEAIFGRDQAIGSGISNDASRDRCAHRVQFWSDEAALLETTEHYLASALNADAAAVAVVTRAHLEELLPRLARWGIDVGQAIQQGSFVHLDADELAAQVLNDARSRWEPALLEKIESAAAATKRTRPHVSFFSECASILWSKGHADAALHLEQRPIEVGSATSVGVLCTYPLSCAADEAAYKVVCAQHGAIAIR